MSREPKDAIARRHANLFLKHLYRDQWDAVYLAMRRELEGDLNWTPGKSLTRDANLKAVRAPEVSDRRDLIELTVSMASTPVSIAYIMQMTGMCRSVVRRYLGELEASGVLTSVEVKHPHPNLWSARG